MMENVQKHNTCTLEFDFQTKGRVPLLIPLMALGFSEWYISKGFNLKCPAAFVPNIKVSPSFAALNARVVFSFLVLLTGSG
jgi:hypothetical protein